MTVIGPNSCGTGTNYNDGGTYPWVNPTLIQGQDNNSAYSSVNGSFSFMTQLLYAENFGFAIPAGAVITTVAFSYRRQANISNNAKEFSTKMIVTGSPSGNEVADGTGLANAYETITKSGNSTYWGVTLTSTVVNAANFGFAIKMQAYSPTAGATVYVDFVSCTVTYNMPSSSSEFHSVCRGIARGICRGM